VRNHPRRIGVPAAGRKRDRLCSLSEVLGLNAACANHARNILRTQTDIDAAIARVLNTAIPVLVKKNSFLKKTFQPTSACRTASGVEAELTLYTCPPTCQLEEGDEFITVSAYGSWRRSRAKSLPAPPPCSRFERDSFTLDPGNLRRPYIPHEKPHSGPYYGSTADLDRFSTLRAS